MNFLKPDPPYHIQSAIARESVVTRYANLPAASDILRLYLLKTFGGLYMDVDVVLKEPLANIRSKNCDEDHQRDYLVKCKLFFKNNMPKIYVGNDILASVKGSSLMSEMLDEAIYPYLETRNNEYTDTINSTASIVEVAKKFRIPAVQLPAERTQSREINENDEFIEAMWCDKRSIKDARFNMTVQVSGPVLLKNVMAENGDKIRCDKRDFGNQTEPLSSWESSNAVMFKNDNDFGKYTSSRAGFKWSESFVNNVTWHKISENSLPRGSLI